MAEFKEKVWIKDVIAKRETDKALLVEIDGDEHWIPKSQIDDDSEVYQEGDEGELVVSMWLAEQRGISK